jgi:hypothetical protein
MDVPALHLGDFALSITPATGTDGHLDTPEGRERVARGEEDARALVLAGGIAPRPRAPVVFGEGGDVDAAIEDAREATAPAPLPILLHDPVTGGVVAFTGAPGASPAAPEK